jgi:hypothetical protein
MSVPNIRSAHSRIAGLHNGRGKNRAPDDPRLLRAQRDLEAAKLAKHVEKVIAGCPPLTTEQLEHIAALLHGAVPAEPEIPAEWQEVAELVRKRGMRLQVERDPQHPLNPKLSLVAVETTE